MVNPEECTGCRRSTSQGLQLSWRMEQGCRLGRRAASIVWQIAIDSDGDFSCREFVPRVQMMNSISFRDDPDHTKQICQPCCVLDFTLLMAHSVSCRAVLARDCSRCILLDLVNYMAASIHKHTRLVSLQTCTMQCDAPKVHCECQRK
jgi:hypothetical protein